MTSDPVERALDRATRGLSSDDASTVRESVLAGLAEIDPTVGPDDLAIEIDVAMDVPDGERVDAARRFAEYRRSFRLGKRSWELLTAFARGVDTGAEAARLLEEILAALDGTEDGETRRELGSFATECRYILSGGAGPNSLRGMKLPTS